MQLEASTPDRFPDSVQNWGRMIVLGAKEAVILECRGEVWATRGVQGYGAVTNTHNTEL